MNLKKLTFRDTQDTSIEVCQAWEVWWTSRHGKYSADVKKEVRVFISEEAAEQFRDALEDAFKLIKHTSEDEVILKKQVL